MLCKVTHCAGRVSMHVHVCMHAHVCKFMYVRMYVCMYVCISNFVLGFSKMATGCTLFSTNLN